jgi:hypothetical protein
MKHMDKKPPAVEAGGEAGGNENDQYTVDPRPPWEIAQALIERGLRPVPVEHRDKKPRHKDWPRRRFSAGNFQFNDSVGLVLGDVVAVDIDITDEALAGQVVALALKVFGPSSIRIGQWPKLVLFFRSATVMKKTKTRSTPAGMVEVLADGQQVVVHGIHKHTGEPYKWKGAPPWAPEFELTTVTPEAVEGFLVDVEALLGLEPVETRSSEQEAAPLHLQAEQHHDTETRREDLERALHEYWDSSDYDAWHKAGLALAHYPQGREIWMTWSATSSKHVDAKAAAKWSGLATSARGEVAVASIMAKVPADVLQEWGREHRIASLATDPQVAEGAAIAKAILPSRRGPLEGDDEAEGHEQHVDDEAAPEPSLSRGGACPPHLLSVPGVLGLAVDFYNQSARRPQPRFAVQTALALGSVVMGRRFVTPMRNYSSLYFLSVADTATGKEHIKSVIEHLLDAAGLSRLIGPDGYTSASGVLSKMLEQPCHITVMDEAGKALASARSRGMQHKADALTAIMEAFGRCDRTLRGQGFSTIGLSAQHREEFSRVVHRPALTLIGMSTPSTLEIAVSDADVQDGFLNRFLYARGSDALVAKSSNPWPAVPEALTAWMQACASAHGGEGNLSGMDTADMPPEPVMVPFAPEASQLFKQFDGEIMQRQGGGPTPRAMLGRTHEHALRLGLIVSASMGRREIDTEAASWAIDYARHHGLEFLAEAATMAAPSASARWVAKLIEQVDRAGGQITHSKLVKNLRGWAGLTTRERETILAMAAADHGLVVEQRRSGSRGPIGQVYYSPTVRHRMSNSKKASSG